MSKLLEIKSAIQQYESQCGLPENAVKLLAVTKNQSPENIISLLNEGQLLFGENRVQEASQKWSALKKQYPQSSLHLIGHLQTNKVAEAVSLFDVIQTLDSVKLAKKLWAEERSQKKQLTYYIEINIGDEAQKTGITVAELPDFYRYVIHNYPLNIQGIMCIPPQEEDPSRYFRMMKTLADEQNLPMISMGMSEDYHSAIQCGSTMVRIGRSLF